MSGSGAQTPKEILYSCAVVLTADLFPVRLDTEAVKFAQVRVLVAEGRAVAWEAKNGQKKKVAELRNVTATKIDPKRWKIVGANPAIPFETEITWACTKNGSCGCGSPLRRLTTREAFK